MKTDSVLGLLMCFLGKAWQTEEHEEHETREKHQTHREAQNGPPQGVQHTGYLTSIEAFLLSSAEPSDGII